MKIDRVSSFGMIFAIGLLFWNCFVYSHQLKTLKFFAFMIVHISLGVSFILPFLFVSGTKCPALMDQSPLQHLCVSLLVALGSQIGVVLVSNSDDL